MPWTEERVQSLTRLWAEGLSASVIATRLGQATRNAVIGKVHRLALPSRPTPPRLKIHRSRPRPAGNRRLMRSRVGAIANPIAANFSTHHFEVEPFVPAAEELQIPPNERKTLQMLENCDCRWPIGDPQSPDFHFCNRRKVPGLSYCEFHARRAFQPPLPRRRDSDVNEPVAPGVAASLLSIDGQPVGV